MFGLLPTRLGSNVAAGSFFTTFPLALGFMQGAGSRITFLDPFSSTLDARWTGAGWSTSSGKLIYSGGAFGSISTPCTAGDNDLSIDWTLSGSSYATAYIRYVDDNNYVGVFADGGNAEKLTLRAMVAGTPTGAIAETSASTFGSGGTLRIYSVGNTIYVTVNGSARMSGTFTQFASATKVGFGLNTGHSSDTMDNAVLA